jgi:hypothetical protein
MSWTETLFLKKIIDGQRTWGASDTIIKILKVYTSSPKGEVVGEFTPKVNGSVRIAAEISTTHASYLGEAYLGVYTKDDIPIGSTSAKCVADRPVTMSVDIPITANTTYIVKATLFVSYNSFNNIRLCGSLIDASLME